MVGQGYRGFFGLDFLIDRRGQIFLSENNARLTASASFYSKVEIKEKRLPLMLFHVLSFFNKKGKTKWGGGRIAGSEVVVRNASSKAVLVKKDFQPGIYAIEGRRLKYIRQAYDIEGAERENEFFLTAAAKGRIVNPEMEILRLDSFTRLLDKDGNLDNLFKILLLDLEQKLLN